MNKLVTNTLLINSHQSQKEELYRLLNENGFKTEVVKDPQEALEKIQEKEFHLIICNKEVNKISGYNIYELLKAEIIHQSIPFILVMQKYDKDDIMIALELGIDNLIFYPLNNEATLLKLKNELIKKQRLNFLNTEDFKDYFNQSQVPMMLIKNEKITALNQPLYNLNKAFFSTIIHQPIETVIDIKAENSNGLKIKRFKNALINLCKLNKVSFKNSDYTFDMLLFRGKYTSTIFYLIELLPVNTLEQPFLSDSLYQNKANLPHLNGIYHQSYPNNLTEREQQILELSATGLPIKIIAHDLNLSRRTIEKHRANVMEKLGARNMIEAIVAWYKHSGLIHSVSDTKKTRLSTIGSSN
ncbi:MAG: LuxR C-terminal-related transcriptional regulator [Anditalea sp.]